MAQDIDAQIKSLDDQAQSLLVQRKALLDDWSANDPDIQLWNRIKAKNEQQRALATQADVLMQQKQELVKQKEATINVSDFSIDKVNP